MSFWQESNIAIVLNLYSNKQKISDCIQIQAIKYRKHYPDYSLRLFLRGSFLYIKYT